MIIGITGTSRGATTEQIVKLREELLAVRPSTLLHGDCVGADAQAHAVALELGIRVEIYPPNNPKSRAFCKGAEVIHPEADYLERNRSIVDHCDMLLALPAGPEKTRSGTWYTMRYARRRGRRIGVIWP